MIRVHISKSGFSVLGHADYAEKGSDIVCSGVSAIAQSVALVLKEECGAKIDIKDGLVIADVEKNKDKYEILAKVLYKGLRNIQNEYPKNLIIQTQRGMKV